MSGIRVVSARLRAVGWVVGVLALGAGAAGCTDGGSDALVVDDDAGAALTAAIDEASAGSGRLRLERTESFSSISGTTVVEQEFSGDDSHTTLSLDSTFEGDTDADTDTDTDFLRISVLEVGGSTYLSSDVVTLFSEDDAGSLPAELAAAEWIDVTDEPEADGLVLSGFASFGGNPLEAFGELSDVSATGTEELDGQSYQQFHATLSDEVYQRVVEGSGGEPESSEDAGAVDEYESTPGEDESELRWQAIEDYGAAHTTIEAEFLVDADGRLRRAVVDRVVDVDEQFADCEFLSSEDDHERLVVDVTDLGADIVIEAPDPAVVISSARAEELTSAMAGMESDPQDMLSTSDGEWRREALIGQLTAQGAVIGLDPASIGALSDEELVARWEELNAALDALPTYDTPMGSMNRQEMLDVVRMGMDLEGVDPAKAESMTDQQLADLITGYLDAKSQELGLADDVDEFEGCPG